MPNLNKAKQFNQQRPIGARCEWDDDEMRIYVEPFKRLRVGAHVIIVTYGITSAGALYPVIKNLQRCNCVVSLLVGYSKKTHNLKLLYDTLMDFRRMKWKVYVMPNLHMKIWAIDQLAWVGSMNFVQQTAPNLMVQVPFTMIAQEVREIFRAAHGFNESTKLHLLPATNINYVR
jgi:hypothetical protein